MATMLDAVINLKDNFSNTLEQVERGIKDFQRTSRGMGLEVRRTGKKLESFGNTMIKSVTLPIVGLGTVATNEFIKIEKAVSGMSKTIEGTPEEVAKIKKELDELATTDLPVDRVDLFGIAETAGQLGVLKDDIVGFTEVVAKIGKVSDLNYETGAASIAKFTNIMGTSNKDLERLGSTIVHLDSNTATTASNIVDMGMRLAAAGKQAGMSEADVLGISAALSSLGLESQAGGTAFSKVILGMNDSVMSGNKNLVKFAKVAGTTAEDFKKMFKDDASGATEKFVKGLGKIQKEGGNVSQVIADMGFNEVRTRDALLRLAGASELYTDVLGKSSEAWEKNMALQEVFDKMTDNTSSRITIMKNQLSTIAEEIGSIVVPVLHEVMGYVEKLTDWFGKLTDEQKENIVKFAGLAAIVGPFILIIGKMTTGVSGAFFAFSDFAKKLKEYGSILGIIKSPAFIVVGVLLALVAAGYLLYKNWDAIKEKVNEVFPNLKEQIGTALEYVKNIFDGTVKFILIAWEFLAPGLTAVWETIKNIFFVGIEFIGGLVGNLLQIFSGIIDWITGVFSGNWELAWSGIVDIFSGVFGIVEVVGKSIINGVIGLINGAIGGMNRIKLPDWVPGLGGKGINIPLIPQLAKGTDNWTGGIVQVHERGGEIIDLPGGSRVYPHDKSVDMARKQGRSESGRSISIAKLADQIIVREESDIDKIADALVRKLGQVGFNMA